jgi:hypothetical protein
MTSKYPSHRKEAGPLGEMARLRTGANTLSCPESRDPPAACPAKKRVRKEWAGNGLRHIKYLLKNHEVILFKNKNVTDTFGSCQSAAHYSENRFKKKKSVTKQVYNLSRPVTFKW